MSYKVVKTTERKYYKYGTPTYNINTVGNLVNTNGVLSNFSTSNYATLPQNFNPGSNPWEMQFKFTTDNNFNQERCIFSQARASDWEGIKIDRDVDHTWITANGWNTTMTGSYKYDYNKTYWLRLSYDGNGTYKLQISEDGVNWVLDVQKDHENSLGYINQNACLGWMAPDPNRYWKNTIDLNGCYIKINGQTFWEGVTIPILPGTEQDYDYYEDVDVYKVVQKTERKYYKYWTQPILTGNNSNPDFVISANVNEGDAYVSFDGIKSNAGWGPKGSGGSFSGLTSWCQMTCSDAINITKITITNRNPGDNANQAITSGSWQVSEDGINWITVNNWTNDNTIVGSSWDINLNYSGFYRYNRLYVYSGTTTVSGNWICVGEVELTARIEGTSSDYDFYEDVPASVDAPWTQPAYNEWVGNNNATWDTSRLYTCTCDGSHNPSAQPGVASLAGSNNGWHSMTSSLPHWVGYYTEPIKVSKFGFQVDGNTSYVPTEFQWQGSNDGSNWVTLGTFTRNSSTTSYEEYIIPESNRKFYAFNRLYITRGNSNYQYICNLQMTATAGKPSYKAIQKLISN